MKTAKRIGLGQGKAAVFTEWEHLEEHLVPVVAKLELPPPRCITDPRRSRRSLYIRLQTWLARFEWEAFRSGREEECRLLYGELHYIAHLLVKSVRACWLCPPEIRHRFEVNRGRT